MRAEKYGAPLSHASRTTAQEFRDPRMTEAEKMAAALPKLTAPMIVFFLLVLLLVVIAPAIVQMMALGF